MWRSLQISTWCIACALIICVYHHHESTKITTPSQTSPHTLPLTSPSLSLRRELQAAEQKGFKVLSLGGSVTWGDGLSHFSHSYAYKMSEINPNVITKNEAIHVSGPEYPSLCISSMIGDEKFDVILLEFSLNDYGYLELLLKRLRQRFPDALIVYVHLYSLQTDIVDERGHTPFPPASANTGMTVYEHKIDTSAEYHWGGNYERSHAKLRDIKGVLSRYNGHVYKLPRPDLVSNAFFLFGDDWHHLSNVGHEVVAKGILHFIKEVAPEGTHPQPRFPPWHVGDKCNSWFKTGKVPHHYTGSVKMMKFTGFGSRRKFALEFKGAGEIFVQNHLSKDLPFYIFFMTLTDAYPNVSVKIGDEPTVVVNTRTGVRRHVMKSQRVGFMKPGRNHIIIEPMGSSMLPFRLTAIAQCEACLHFDTDIFDSKIGSE